MAFTDANFAAGIQHAAGIVCQLEKDLSVASTGFIARDAAIRALDLGVGSGRIISGLDSARAAVNAGLGVLARTLIEPLLSEKLQVLVGKPGSLDDEQAWDDLYAYDVTNSKAVLSRTWTRGAVDAGGPEDYTNAGAGTCYRLLVDKHSQALQGGDPGVIEVKCVSALGAGTSRYRTKWRAQYRAPARDAMARYSSPRRVEPVEFAELYPVETYLTNPSFDSGSAAALTAAPSGWEVVTGTITNHSLNGTYYLRKDGQATPLSMKAAGEDLRLAQTLAITGKVLPRSKPLIRALGYNRETGTWSGTLYLYTGAEATSVVLAAQTGWQWLVSAMEDGCWWQGGQEEDNPQIEFFADRTAGDLYLDAFIIQAMAGFAEQWFAVLGSPTADDFHIDDVFTFTDSEVAGGYIQKAVCYGFPGRQLRHAGAPSGYTEPTIA
ncbi:MAG: hypothetical protein FD152_680 [Xanthobacteraceae bacterium]|nr:MAG: hypothetical protein FD152_680 [Xanthobacteraceae bacterium]